MPSFLQKVLPYLLKGSKVLLWVLQTFWYIFERLFLLAFLIFLTVGLAWWLSQRPSNYRDWSVDQAILPTVTFSGDLVSVEHVRDFSYRSTTDYDPAYYDRVYDLDSIESVEYIIEPFSENDGPAHTMLSFGFSGGVFVTVSAEIRKEKGEKFSPWLGLMNQYEMMYVVGDERDLIQLRANHRRDKVYLYPVATEKSKMQDLFISVMRKVDQLSREPEWYNTLWNTCATSILRHANSLREEKIPWSRLVLLPSHSDQILYERGLIDTRLSLPEAREYYQINALSEKHAGSEDYPRLIRKQRR